MKKIQLALTLVLIGALAACATTASGPAFAPAPTPPQGSGLMYLMRSPLVGNDAAEVAFVVDGQDVAELNSKGYTWLHLPAGRHNVKTEYRSVLHGAAGKMNISVDVQAGGQYFVERVDQMVTYPQYLSQLKLVPPAVASETIKAYRYTPAAAPQASASAPEPVADASKATVYLYRSGRQPAYIDLDIILSVDGKKLCGMDDRRYAVFQLDPGRHDIKAEWDPWKKPFFAKAYDDKSLSLAVEGGKKYHVSYQVNGRDGVLYDTALVSETEAQAQANLALATLKNDCKR